MIKVFTGTSPFSGLTDTLAIQQIIYGGRPSRPQGQDLTDPIWYMTTRCWQEDPLLRPKMMEVVTILRERQVFFPLQHEHIDMLLFIAVVGCPLQLRNNQRSSVARQPRPFQEEWRYSA